MEEPVSSDAAPVAFENAPGQPSSLKDIMLTSVTGRYVAVRIANPCNVTKTRKGKMMCQDRYLLVRHAC